MRKVRVEVRVYNPGFDPAVTAPVEGEDYVAEVQWLQFSAGATPQGIAELTGLQAKTSVNKIMGVKTSERDGGRA